jgi:ribose transport system permease protein
MSEPEETAAPEIRGNTAARVAGGGGVSGFFRRLNTASEIISILIALVIMVVVFSLTSRFFLTPKNILNVLMNISILGIMTAGLFVSMIIGEIDLSQYAILAVSTAISVVLIKSGMAIGPAVVIGIAAALACGVINGSMVAFLRINPIITTLGAMLIYRGIAYKLTGMNAIGVSGAFFDALSGKIFGIPVSIFILIGVFILVHVLLTFTAHGKRVYAVGGNPEASFISGISVRMVRFWGLVISAATAALAGLIFVAQLGVTMPRAGESGMLDVLTAVVIGGTSLSGGKGRIIGVLIGVLVIAVLQNGMALLSVQSYYQNAVKGGVILLAVFVDSVRGGGYK